MEGGYENQCENEVDGDYWRSLLRQRNLLAHIRAHPQDSYLDFCRGRNCDERTLRSLEERGVEKLIRGGEMEARELFGLLLRHAVRMESALLVNDPESLLSAKLNGKAKELRPAVKELEQKGLLAVYRKRGGKIDGVVFLREEYPTEIAQSQPEPERAVPQIDVLAIQSLRGEKKETRRAPELKAGEARRPVYRLQRAKGEVRQIREWAEAGDRNEYGFQGLLLELVRILLERLPHVVHEATCERSGRYRPEIGALDKRDRDGEDVRLSMSTCLKMGYIIYDPKRSRRRVEEFNRNIQLRPGQKDALMKRAIWTLDVYRSRFHLASEVLSDMVSVGLLPSDLKIEELLAYFE